MKTFLSLQKEFLKTEIERLQEIFLAKHMRSKLGNLTYIRVKHINPKLSHKQDRLETEYPRHMMLWTKNVYKHIKIIYIRNIV